MDCHKQSITEPSQRVEGEAHQGLSDCFNNLMNLEHTFERKWGGWKLAAYHWEEQTYPQFRKEKVSRERANQLIIKFIRHFKTPPVFLSYKIKRGDAGHYLPNSYRPSISLGENPSLAVVCHEFAHHLEYTRHHTRQWHGKKFKRELKRVYTFAKRYLPNEKATPPQT